MFWITPFLHEKIIRVSLGQSSRMLHHPTVGSAQNMTQLALHYHFLGSYWARFPLITEFAGTVWPL